MKSFCLVVYYFIRTVCLLLTLFSWLSMMLTHRKTNTQVKYKYFENLLEYSNKAQMINFFELIFSKTQCVKTWWHAGVRRWIIVAAVVHLCHVCFASLTANKLLYPRSLLSPAARGSGALTGGSFSQSLAFYCIFCCLHLTATEARTSCVLRLSDISVALKL